MALGMDIRPVSGTRFDVTVRRVGQGLKQAPGVIKTRVVYELLYAPPNDAADHGVLFDLLVGARSACGPKRTSTGY
jgi:hypothetical protein